MRTLLLGIPIAIVVTAPFTTTQDSNLRAQLEPIHHEWFAAFDKGDGATVNKLEASNLVLVFPDGTIWKRPGPRVGNAKPTGFKSRSLADVEVRQFGDTAVLTGLLKSVGADAKSSVDGTTVIFVRQNGKWVIASGHWSHSGQKVTFTQTIVVSGDGKARTTTTTGTDAKGQKVDTISFYEKQ